MIKWLTVLLLGAVSQPVAITTGLALEVDPLLTAIMTTIGGILAVLVILGLSDRIRNWKWVVEKHYCEIGKDRSGRICRVWDRYGVAGLGLLAPSLIGAPVGTIIGITLGSQTRALLLWMSTGIFIWSAVSAYGINIIIGIRTLLH